MRISAVIPTRNRPDSLRRLLESIQQQTLQVQEVIIVDSSDDTSYHQSIKNSFSDLPLVFITTRIRSVCAQRNMGIQIANGEWMFLCDDDIEAPTDYVEKLVNHLGSDPACGAIAGRCLQLENGVWVDQYPVRNFTDIFWRYIFQTSIWGDVHQVKPPSWLKLLHSRIISFYRQRGNTYTRAGWPLITQWEDSFSTSFYSLGANIIRRDWLVLSPYDEILDSNGIGDNYGVALGFRGGVKVLSSTFVYHHVEKSNRLHETISYYRRVLALHYFIKKSKKYPTSTERWLLWSLFGNSLKFMTTFRWLHVWASWKAMWLILLNRNPYWAGFSKGKKMINPQLTFLKRE